MRGRIPYCAVLLLVCWLLAAPLCVADGGHSDGGHSDGGCAVGSHFPTVRDRAYQLLAQRDVPGALRCLLRATQLEPQDPFVHAQYGDLLAQAGQCESALPHLQTALHGFTQQTEQFPEHRRETRWMEMFANLHYVTAQCWQRTGRIENGLQHAAQTVKILPNHLGAANLVGILLMARGDAAGAVRAYRRALRIDSRCAPCLVNMGAALDALGDRSAALQAYRVLIAEHGSGLYRDADLPRDVLDALTAGYIRYAELLGTEGRPREAVELLQSAVKNWPGHGAPSALYNALGNALDAVRDPALHPAMRQAYRAALQRDPQSEPAAANYARALRMTGQRAAAVAFLREQLYGPHGRLARGADSAALHAHLADAHKDGDELAAAVAEYERAIAYAVARSALSHGEPEPHVLCNMVFALQTACHWHHPLFNMTALWRLVLASARGAYQCVIPIQAMLYPLGPRQLQTVARLYAAAIVRAAAAASAPHGLPPPPPRPALADSGRLRVGFLSADIRPHPLAFLMRHVFGWVDAARFEVHMFTTTPDDGSALRREILASVAHVHELAGLPLADAVRVLRRPQLHILVDLNGHTQGGRLDLLAHRPAPLVVNYMGFCGTQGTALVHVHVTDRVTVPPEHARYFDERLLLMPHTYFVNDHRQRFSALPPPPDRAAIGLPPNQTVLCSFASLPKLDDATVALWLRILQRAPHTVLWLLRWPDACIDRLLEAAAAAGLPAARLVFSNATDFERHVARIPLCDLHLDPLHVSTHTVACDVLFAGTPTVTAPGRTIASRVAASIAAALGVPEMVAADAAQYEERAVHWAQDADDRQRLRDRVRQAVPRAPLFDTRGWVRRWEQGLRLLWDAPPSHHVVMRHALDRDTTKPD